MTSENVSEPEAVESAKAVDDRLIDELVDRAQAKGRQLTGEGGLLQQLTSACWSPPSKARSPTPRL